MTVVTISEKVFRDRFEDHATSNRAPAGRIAKALAWLAGVVHPFHTPRTLALAWEDFRAAVRARTAIDTGTRHWSEFYDPGECAGTGHAVELKCSEADDAFAVIVRGVRL